MSAYQQILRVRSHQRREAEHRADVGQRVLRLSAEQQNWIAADYRRGRSMALLADELGVRRSTISAVLDRMGIERRPQPGMTKKDIETAVALYEAGESLKAIERILDFHAETVRHQLHRHGIRLRPAGRPAGRSHLNGG